MDKNPLEKLNKGNGGAAENINNKIEVVNNLDSTGNELVNKFVQDIIFLVENFDNKIMVSNKFEGRSSSVFSPFDANCEGLVDSLKKSQAVVILAKEARQMLPNQRIKYFVAFYMKLTQESGEVVTVSLDENGREMSLGRTLHGSLKEVEENKQKFLD